MVLAYRQVPGMLRSAGCTLLSSTADGACILQTAAHAQQCRRIVQAQRARPENCLHDNNNSSTLLQIRESSTLHSRPGSTASPNASKQILQWAISFDGGFSPQAANLAIPGPATDAAPTAAWSAPAAAEHAA